MCRLSAGVLLVAWFSSCAEPPRPNDLASASEVSAFGPEHATEDARPTADKLSEAVRGTPEISDPRASRRSPQGARALG